MLAICVRLLFFLLLECHFKKYILPNIYALTCVKWGKIIL